MPTATAVAAAMSKLGIDTAAVAAECQKMSRVPSLLAKVEAAAAELLARMHAEDEVMNQSLGIELCPPQKEVREALAKKELVPIGTDPTTGNTYRPLP